MDGLEGEVDAIERALAETPFRRNPKGALLRVAAVVATGAIKDGPRHDGSDRRGAERQQAIEKAFGPASPPTDINNHGTIVGTVFGLAAKAYDQLRDIHAVIWKCQFG